LLARHEPIESFADAAGGPDGFPSVAWLEPRYGGAQQNDGHPPASIHNAENLVARVYNALRWNESLWQRSLLIVVTDECGGFYDPVVPPHATPPGPDPVYKQLIYNRLGFRFPCLLISPWLPARVGRTP
jgi:phospholipase C